ncbi:hypothetical protein CTI12_AA495650 [Artemisia annua]|uniref:PH domain-containing protein n=1 Tax=Artemisia annua TaxID=35608 RepID=A0A2U1LG71_ARTAN|nr:hypothetical protein CTI12_AA495650 [Artemisia annua]
MSNTKVVYDGWMVRYGRRKIGRSFLHMRYFVLESRLLAYYKRKPQDNVVPIKTLVIDGNCRVEDRGLKTQHGHIYGVYTEIIIHVFVLSYADRAFKQSFFSVVAYCIDVTSLILFGTDAPGSLGCTTGINTYSFEYKVWVDSGRNGLLIRSGKASPPESIPDLDPRKLSILASQNANKIRHFQGNIGGSSMPKLVSFVSLKKLDD